MKVAIIIERIETWRGGAETSTMQFAEYLAKDGCHVSILTTSYPPSTSSLSVVPIAANGMFRALKTRQFIEGASEYVRTHDFDIVHCITPCPAADVYQPRGGTIPETLERNLAMRSSRIRRGLKRLAQRTSLKYRIMEDLERQLLQRQPPPWVIAISHYVEEQLSRHYRFDPSRVRHIFNGVDPDTTPAADRLADRTKIRRQYGLAGRDLMLLCVAHNFRLKGVGSLVEALARQEADGAAPAGRKQLAVVVGRDDPAPFVKLADQLGVRERIVFTGPTPRVRAFFHAADLLVHATYYDPCSRVVLEALASGLPAITTRFNGAAERIEDGREGYVIDSPEDTAGLADCIGRLQDDEHRRACAQRAPQAVEGCSMRRHAERVRELYEEIVRQGEPRRAGYR
ncbi:MAG: hypothetical protein AMXMBFR13_34830 [Phycisphaerae bacterium]